MGRPYGKCRIKTRPLNPTLDHEPYAGKAKSLEMAMRLIDEAGSYATGVTVQTVISSKNDNAEHFSQFRDWLISRCVRNWVLHTAINAGAARKFSVRTAQEQKRYEGLSSSSKKKMTTILPNHKESARFVRQLINSTQNEGHKIDIRCTDASAGPNRVLLVGSEGALYTQGRGANSGRKVKIADPDTQKISESSIWTYVSCLDHVQRYVNFAPSIHGGEAPKPFKIWD